MYKNTRKGFKSILIVGIVFITNLLLISGTSYDADVRQLTTINNPVKIYNHDYTNYLYTFNKSSYVVVPTAIVEPVKEVKPTHSKDPIEALIEEICEQYPRVKPSLVKSIIWHESRFNPKEKTGNCLGLMQINPRWHEDRAKRLGVTDYFDPRSNILLGVDYLDELLEQYKDPSLVLMLYNMNHNTAFKMYREGKISKYAKSVLSKEIEYKKGE